MEIPAHTRPAGFTHVMASVVCLICSFQAKADTISFTFDQSTYFVSPGQSIVISGTLSHTDPTQELVRNFDEINPPENILCPLIACYSLDPAFTSGESNAITGIPSPLTLYSGPIVDLTINLTIGISWISGSFNVDVGVNPVPEPSKSGPGNRSASCPGLHDPKNKARGSSSKINREKFGAALASILQRRAGSSRMQSFAVFGSTHFSDTTGRGSESTGRTAPSPPSPATQ
jgi:hypothetical protein